MSNSEPIDPKNIEFLCDRLDEQGIEYHIETKLFIHQKNKNLFLILDDFNYVSDNLNFFQIIFTNYFT